MSPEDVWCWFHKDGIDHVVLIANYGCLAFLSCGRVSVVNFHTLQPTASGKICKSCLEEISKIKSLNDFSEMDLMSIQWEELKDQQEPWTIKRKSKP